jgi:hypothetical protein
MGPHTCYLPLGTKQWSSTLAQMVETHRCDRHSSLHEGNPIRRTTSKVRPTGVPLKGTTYMEPSTGTPTGDPNSGHPKDYPVQVTPFRDPTGESNPIRPTTGKLLQTGDSLQGTHTGNPYRGCLQGTPFRRPHTGDPRHGTHHREPPTRDPNQGTPINGQYTGNPTGARYWRSPTWDLTHATYYTGQTMDHAHWPK